MKKNPFFYLFLTIITALSVASFIFWYSNGELNLANGDTRSRLNIALRVTQNLTPGLAQLGGVWLPLPQLLEAPLVVIRPLYITGAAGYIISGISFIISGIFIYKLIYLYTQKHSAAFLGGLIFATCINMLYLQTTALAESFFIMNIVGATYFLSRWVFEKKYTHLPIAGIFVMLATLTRYEGYAVFAAAVLVVILVTVLSSRPRIKYLESNLILFTTVAALGIAIWLLYNGLIFGNPFQSFKVYTGSASVISTEASIISRAAETSKTRPILDSVLAMSTVTLEMVGVLITIVGSLGFLFFVIKSILAVKKYPNYMWSLFPLLVLLAPLAFLLLMYVRGYPITFPKLSIANLFDSRFNSVEEINIRYGIQSLPFFAIFAAFLASRNKLMAIFVWLVVVAQISLFFYPAINVAYYLPIKVAKAYPSQRAKTERTATWLRQNYKGGLVLLSVYEHDPDTFYFPIPYKNYIFEGTGKYWKQSIKNPKTYATWVMMKNGPKPKKLGNTNTDIVSYHLKDEPVLTDNFDLVYKDELFLIYKNKTQPEVQVTP